MWIESQDEDNYMNLERTKSLHIERVMEQKAYVRVLVSCDVYADEVLLGKYPSEKQAKRALKLVMQEAVNFRQEPKHLMKMPKCITREEEENGGCI